MRMQIDIKPTDLEENDTIAGFKIKDIATIAYCLREKGVSEQEVDTFVRNLRNAYDVAVKDTQEAIDAEWRRIQNEARREYDK